MKRIVHIKITNHFVDLVEIMSISMPLNGYKVMRAFYSSKWRDLKPALASICRVDKRFIKAKTWINQEGDPKNIIVSLPSGFRLTYPEDSTPYDIKIILKQLEVLEMSIKPVIDPNSKVVNRALKRLQARQSLQF